MKRETLEKLKRLQKELQDVEALYLEIYSDLDEQDCTSLANRYDVCITEVNKLNQTALGPLDWHVVETIGGPL